MDIVKNTVLVYSERFLKSDLLNYKLFLYTSDNKYDVIVISEHKKVLSAQTCVFQCDCTWKM